MFLESLCRQFPCYTSEQSYPRTCGSLEPQAGRMAWTPLALTCGLRSSAHCVHVSTTHSMVSVSMYQCQLGSFFFYIAGHLVNWLTMSKLLLYPWKQSMRGIRRHFLSCWLLEGWLISQPLVCSHIISYWSKLHPHFLRDWNETSHKLFNLHKE